ncbi:NtaA/DmoA family FMN-dependent monooxygenase [Paenibacillus agricola]|uniref:NtaA/DmoA family FMN-dependent monooxygenase n=1 Tax=Paenibacillus agricola TaxID=2716264 RepID=A0ABX0J4Z9_9BACL|nr:NtaA/DmoA family FMN-dependent monooxygenase [Paenibacillus agricola]NHN28890.1 NtaA/DmoA family FMN-dependent monooxygenase [Paenibacillus agricola]
MTKKIHFGWFSQYAGPVGFNNPKATEGADWRQPDMYQKMAQICEKGKFDFALFADHLGISSDSGKSIDSHVLQGVTVCHDSTVLAAMVAAQTNHLGVGATLSTSLTLPYQLARQLASLDHLSKGRVAWNIVTSYSKSAFDNFGHDSVPEHDARYDQADEFMELCYQLWNSWEKDAVVMDKESGMFADPSKVKPIHFEGDYYKCAGPLNMVPPVEGKPVTIQAGSSDRGMEFASRWADAVIVAKQTVDDMKIYYDSLKGRLHKYGRNPEEVKVLFIIKPIFAATEELARQKAAEPVSDYDLHRAISQLSTRMNRDLTQLDLDEPVPTMSEKEITGGQTTLSRHQTQGQRPTLRQIATKEVVGNNLDIVGTPEQVADQLQLIMETIGGDGFVLRVNPHEHQYMQEFVDMVVPVLQQRGAMRAEYTGHTLRDNLLEY